MNYVRISAFLSLNSKYFVFYIAWLDHSRSINKMKISLPILLFYMSIQVCSTHFWILCSSNSIDVVLIVKSMNEIQQHSLALCCVCVYVWTVKNSRCFLVAPTLSLLQYVSTQTLPDSHYVTAWANTQISEFSLYQRPIHYR